MTEKPTLIAIDGPAASGKTTLGYALAEQLDYLFFDTGVMYRAVTLAALDRAVPLDDAVRVGALAEELDIDIAAPEAGIADGRHYTVLVDGVDRTWDLRTPEVDRNVSVVSAYSRVRKALSAKQRAIGRRYVTGQAEQPGIVMVGRDIGTVVLPDAPLKLYVDASPEERAHRRCLEQRARGDDPDYAEILADIVTRDRQDSERAHSPLRAAKDAVVVDTSTMSPEQVVRAAMALVDTRGSLEELQP